MLEKKSLWNTEILGQARLDSVRSRPISLPTTCRLMSIPAELITKILTILRQSFDYVVVDTPPAFDDQVLAAFDQSDIIVNLATLDIPAIKNLKLTLETLDLLNFPRERWQIVLNRADSKVGLSVHEVEKSLGASIALSCCVA